MMALRLRTALAALTLLAASPALAVTDIVEGAPVSVLVEEELLSSDEREIPADGKIELRLPEGLPETALRLEDFSFDPRSGLFAARVIGVDGLTLTFRGQAMVTVPTYVPRRRIPAGTKLTEQDFRLVHMNAVAMPAGAGESVPGSGAPAAGLPGTAYTGPPESLGVHWLWPDAPPR